MGSIRSPLTWLGGKSRLAHRIVSLFPPHRCYVEPFGGAAWVLLSKPPSPVEVYNDIDESLVNFFRVLRERGEELHKLLVNTPCARREHELCRYTYDDPSLDELERARRFFVSVRCSFGGKVGRSFAYSSVSSVGVKFYKPVDELLAVRDRFRSVVIECLDFRDLIPRYDSPETLFYCDPPYLPDTRRDVNSTRYRHEMTERDHVELLELVNSVRGMVVLSGYDSELYRSYLDDRGWSRREVKQACFVVGRTRGTGLRGVNAVTDSGQVRLEVVWLSPRCLERGLWCVDE